MFRTAKLRIAILGLAVTSTFSVSKVLAQSPRLPFFQASPRSAQVADDESPFQDDPIEQPMNDGGEYEEPSPTPEADAEPLAPAPPAPPVSLAPPAALAPPPGFSPLAPGALGGAGFASSIGATRDSFSAAPNMIGDLFNSGTSSLNFNTKFEVNPFFSAVGVADANSLVSGINTPITGINVTSLSNIGDVVRVGDSSSISLADLSPINSVIISTGTLGDATSLLGPQSDPFTPNVVQAGGSPVENSLIFQAANRAISEQLSSGIGGEIDIEDTITLTYIDEESTILGGDGDVIGANFVYSAAVSLPIPSPGEVVGRYSIADNNSPLPQNRLFLDYNFFHNARITAAGIPVNRWAPGFESTFADGLGSIEFRAPMAVTLTSAVNTSGDDLAAYEFGDISFTLKGLLHQDDRVIASAGLGITLPTADDFTLTLEDDSEVVRIENESVHLLPFVAGSINLTRNAFVQSFAQFDFDTNGNSVFLDEQGFRMQGAGQLQGFGKLKSQSTLRFSNSAGYFLFRNRQKRVSDLAAVLEAHYTGTLNKSDSVGSENFAIGDPTRTLSVLNLTSGLHAYMGKSVVTAAYGVPVTEDRVFDGELRLFINRYF